MLPPLSFSKESRGKGRGEMYVCEKFERENS